MLLQTMMAIIVESGSLLEPGGVRSSAAAAAAQLVHGLAERPVGMPPEQARHTVIGLDLAG